jgi:hypothetical protein
MKTNSPALRKRTREETIDLIRNHVETTGRMPVQMHDKTEQSRLGNACMTLRAQHARDELDAAVIAELEAIPGWQWRLRRGRPTNEIIQQRSVYDPRWQARFIEVAAFAKSHGRIPQDTRGGALVERRLAQWCMTQRNRARLSDSSLPPEIVAQLNSVTGWYWDRVTDDAHWMERYTAYSTFLVDNGREPLRSSADAHEARLGDWRRTQRSKYANALIPPHTAEQIRLLESIEGWAWVDPNGRGWEKSFTELTGLLAAGEALPNWSSKLGRWILTQRADYASGKLTRLWPDRVDALNDIPGWLWTVDREDTWLENYVALAHYAMEHGKFPTMHDEDEYLRKISRWSSVMRRSIIPGQTTMVLSGARIAALELIPGWYWGAKPKKAA